MSKVIILEDLNFTWEEKVIDDVIVMWEKGFPLQDIAEKIERNNEETFLLLMHLSLKNKIKGRKRGIWGHEKEE